jgi:D-sedoheptulose 7-phosphate isomerase
LIIENNMLNKQIKYRELLINNLQLSIAAKQQFLEDLEQIELFSQIVELVVKSYQKGGRIYIAGNGGSAADAQHLAAEFVSKLAKEREPLPAEALTVDSSILTAISNDYGYEKVFSRQLAAKLREHDIFLGITTSGNSSNILEALKQCKYMQIPSIVFCARDGGQALALADYCIIATGQNTSTIQELHIVLAHTLCECVENEIFN